MDEQSLRSRSWVTLTGIGLLAASLAAPAAAQLRIVTANDFLTSNRRADDLYTGAFSLEIAKGRYRFTAGEDIFTDSEKGLRFDETYFAVERGLPSRGAWRSSAQVGLVHVGEGLLGERAQNAVHRLIGNETVDLDYVDSNRLYPTLKLRFERPLISRRGLSLTSYTEAFSAIGFKEHAAAGLQVVWPALSSASFIAGFGARYSSARFEPLAPYMSGLAPAWQAGVRLLESTSLIWSYNEFGTKAQHFTLGYDVRPRRHRHQDG